jgi:hypothetical protein
MIAHRLTLGGWLPLRVPSTTTITTITTTTTITTITITTTTTTTGRE